jgi:hypothetical protein
MACECDGFARQSSKLLDKVRFLGELPQVDGAVFKFAQRRSFDLRDCGFECRTLHLTGDRREDRTVLLRIAERVV